jgi:hypothetical protein
MYNLYLFKAVYIAHGISLEKKGLECTVIGTKDKVILPTLASSANNFPIISQKGFNQACLPISTK